MDTFSCHREIAETIIERSPSIAIRITGSGGKWSTLFITNNVSSYGYTREDFMKRKVAWGNLIHPDDQEDVATLLDSFAELHNDQYNIVYRILRADGHPIWVSHSGFVVRDGRGEVLYTDCIISDYTETKEHIEKIGENLRQQSVLNTILQGLHDADQDKALHILLDSAGAYLDLGRVLLFADGPDHKSCRVVHEWCNKGVPSLLGNGEFVINYDNGIPEVAAALSRDGRCIVDYDAIPPVSGKDMARGDVRAAAIFVVMLEGKRYGFISFDECARDRHWDQDSIRFLDSVSRLVSPVLIRRENERIIKSMALTDQLTGLNNRHHLEACLEAAIARARDGNRSGFVLFIDMDDFKVINDAYGHDHGDGILREVSAFLKAHFGDNDSVFRFGGDEFVIVVEPNHPDDIHDSIASLLARGQLPWKVLDRTFYCTLSIGVVRYPEAHHTTREVIKNADIAMYQAKKMGKNTYMFYSEAIDHNSLARAEIEKAMRESIDNGFAGFEVHYQPLTDLNRKIIGAEALMRWALPDGTRLRPDQFIPLAEYLGLIVPIGEFALREATRQCKDINALFPDFFTSVNVSIRQFKQREFVETTQRILDEAAVDYNNIVLEITEGMAIHDLQRMKYLAGELRKKGVRVSMDDFGTGYSSLGNLRQLPIDVVKIDKSFIHDVNLDAYSTSFIRFISDLVHSMDKKVCIEGVETASQLSYCRDCRADYVQGYHLWRPMPAKELRKLMGLETA